MAKKQTFNYKTYEFLHGANHAKENLLWDFHDAMDNLKSHRDSLIKISKPKKINQTVEQYTDSLENYDKIKKQAQGIKDIYTTDRFIRILVNKKSLVEDDIFSNELKTNIKPTEIKTNIIKHREVAFDLGLCVLLATSDGETYGNYWLDKLTEYDKKITDLMAARQSCGLKVRSVRYDQLIAQVKGFIKSEINKILNQYFATHLDIYKVQEFFSNVLEIRLLSIAQINLSIGRYYWVI